MFPVHGYNSNPNGGGAAHNAHTRIFTHLEKQNNTLDINWMNRNYGETRQGRGTFSSQIPTIYAGHAHRDVPFTGRVEMNVGNAPGAMPPRFTSGLGLLPRQPHIQNRPLN